MKIGSERSALVFCRDKFGLLTSGGLATRMVHRFPRLKGRVAATAMFSPRELC